MKMTKEKISDYFIELLSVLEIVDFDPMDNNVDRIYYYYKDKLYIDYIKEAGMVYINVEGIWDVFEKNYSDKDIEIRQLIKTILEKHFKMKEITVYKDVLPF